MKLCIYLSCYIRIKNIKVKISKKKIKTKELMIIKAKIITKIFFLKDSLMSFFYAEIKKVFMIISQK